MAAGDAWLDGPAACRDSLRVLGTTGEPIGDHAHTWFREVGVSWVAGCELGQWELIMPRIPQF